jgi:multicomponent Na+:H+ antiporter subunit B
MNGREPVSRTEWTEWDAPRERWLLTGSDDLGWKRTLLLEAATRVVFPTVLVLSVYLLFAGHYDAGGGFSGGLVAGHAFVLRYIAGGRAELTALVRVRPPTVIGAGLSIAVLTALMPLAFGKPVLATAIAKLNLPLLGELKLPTSLFLDIGVYLLIVGVVLDLLRTLGAGIETQEPDRAGPEDEGGEA